jgi:PAS domain S-box-containing protein
LNISSISLQAILQSSPHGYALTCQASRILWVNDTFTRIFGYSAEECLGQNLEDLIAPDGYQCEHKDEIALLSTNGVAVKEELRLHKNGKSIHVSISTTPIYEKDGTFRTCYHYTDISNRVKAEHHASVLRDISHAINSTQNLKELYSSIHGSLSRLLDTTNFFIALYDEQSDQIKFVHYTDVGEEAGKEIEVIDHASLAKGSYTAQVIFREKPILLSAEQIHRDYDSVNKPVGPISLSWLGVPLCIKDKVIGAVAVQSYTTPNSYDENDIAILQSVTEQIAIAIETKQTEQELVESELLHKTLFNQGADAIFVHDLNGKILKANDVALARFGFSEAELLELSVTDIYNSYSVHEIFEARVHSSSVDYSSHIQEATQRTKSGSEIISELHSKEMYYKGQKAVICSARDITEKKAREKEKHALERRLSRAQTMQALGQLAGGVAHDLNNILSGISSYPELMLLKLPEDSPLRQPLEMIKNSGFRAAEIVDDMLTLTRLGKKGESVINLNCSIENFLATPEYLKLKEQNPNIQVITTHNNQLLNIEGSEVHISKVILNILKNGFEAILERGRIHIATDNLYVSSLKVLQDFVPEGEYVIMRISDSGVGIPDENIEHIFEPFYTTKQMGNSGTGLGMAIVWRTVKNLNGYIDVSSSKDNGTSFTLYFPASRKELSEKPHNINISEYLGHGELLYIVDDIPEQRLIASSILHELGYRVRTFENGEDVLAFLEARQEFPHLFILDMIMEPGIDGAETFRNICALAPQQKALIASGFSENKQVKAASSMGVAEHLKKPYTLENLARAVKKALTVA